MDKLVELTSVTAGYGEHIVLRDVDFAVGDGDFIGVIGPNGGGKSTLLKVILGLISPIQGTVRFAPNSKEDPLIGYLPQFNVVDRKFPIAVLDVVLSGMMSRKGIGRRFSRKDRSDAEEMLVQMGIGHLKNKAIGELSGGQMQRTFLCRALISSPRLLLLDEPNTFVDAEFGSDFYEILEHLHAEIAIVLVSHEIGVIAPHVKSIACINETLYYHSSNEVTQELMGHYHCPIDIITHGEIPHRVLKRHGGL